MAHSTYILIFSTFIFVIMLTKKVHKVTFLATKLKSILVIKMKKEALRKSRQMCLCQFD